MFDEPSSYLDVKQRYARLCTHRHPTPPTVFPTPNPTPKTPTHPFACLARPGIASHTQHTQPRPLNPHPCTTQPARRPDHPLAGGGRDGVIDVRAGGGARPGRAGLPVGLHLLPLRHPLRLRRRHHALLRPRGDQHVRMPYPAVPCRPTGGHRTELGLSSPMARANESIYPTNQPTDRPTLPPNARTPTASWRASCLRRTCASGRRPWSSRFLRRPTSSARWTARRSTATPP